MSMLRISVRVILIIIVRSRITSRIRGRRNIRGRFTCCIIRYRTKLPNNTARCNVDYSAATISVMASPHSSK